MKESQGKLFLLNYAKLYNCDEDTREMNRNKNDVTTDPFEEYIRNLPPSRKESSSYSSIIVVYISKI